MFAQVCLTLFTNLRNVVLNDGIKRIKGYSFGACTSLEHITIPSTVVKVDDSAFKDCTGLREVVIYNEKAEIAFTAFNNCTSLERFKFPGLFHCLNDIIQVGQRGIEAKLDDIPAVEWRSGELIMFPIRREVLNPFVPQNLVKLDKEKLTKIVRFIRHYEIKEATTLFELALWKSKIDQAEEANMNRNAHRVEVPGPVKDTILQYLK